MQEVTVLWGKVRSFYWKVRGLSLGQGGEVAFANGKEIANTQYYQSSFRKACSVQMIYGWC